MSSKVLRRASALSLLLLGLLLPSGCGEPAPNAPAPTRAAFSVEIPEGAEAAVRVAIEEALEQAQAGDTAEDWLQLGRVLHAHGLTEDAAGAYAEASERAETDGARLQAAYLAGVAWLDRSPALARRELTRAESIDGAYPIVKLRLARLDEREGHLERARARYEAVLQRIDSAHAELGLARLAFAADELGEALRRVDRALALRADFREAHATRSQVLAALGRPEEARDAATRAAASNETTEFTDPFLQDVHREVRSFTGLLLQANRHRTAGRHGPALIAAERALEVRPDHPDARLTRAVLLTELGRTDEAAEALAGLLRDTPTFDGLADAVRVHLRAAGRSSDVATFDTLLLEAAGSSAGPDGDALADLVE